MKPWRRWTSERCCAEALKCKTRSEFRRKGRAYRFALKNGLMNKICGHMIEVQKPRGYWTFERCYTESLKYRTRTDFRRKGGGSAYNVALKNGWMDKICGHMIEVQKPSGYWTLKRCHTEALKYETYTAFRCGSSSAVNAAFKNGWTDEILGHMIKIKRPKGYWTSERCCAEALKCKTRSEFRRKGSAYQFALKNGLMDKICGHMIEVHKPSGYWTLKRCRTEALKYETYAAFSKDRAYSAAVRNGFLNRICGHLQRGKGGFDSTKPGIFYYLAVQTRWGKLNKIGVTNSSVEERFCKKDLERITVLRITEFDLGADAYAEEQRILREFAEFRYTGEDVLLSGGNTEMFTRDVLGLDKEKNNEYN